MAQDFPFVNVSKTLAIDKQSRLAIRSQVSKDFHRRVRSGHAEPRVPAPAGHQLHRFRLKSKQTQKRQASEPELEGLDNVQGRSIQKGLLASKALVKVPTKISSLLDILRTAGATMHKKDSNVLNDYVNFSMTLATSLASGFPDPFETLCIPSSPQIQYLLHCCEALLFSPLLAHFPLRRLLASIETHQSQWLISSNHLVKEECTGSELMLSYRRQCFSLSIGDQALFYLGLSFTAENLAMFKVDNIGPMDYLIFRTKAIRLVNEKMRTNEAAIEDATINCVAHMALYEAANGQKQAVRTHLTGLKKMISMRGGLVNTDMSSALQRIILWTDLFTSNALSRPPAAWLSDAAKEILSPPEPLCQTECSLSNTNISNSSKLGAILSTFRRISSILESSSAANIERFDDDIYSDQVYHLQHELMILSIDADMAPPDISHDRSRVKYLATAALIYLHVVFFKAPAKSLIIQDMVERLRAIFDDSTEIRINDETENTEVNWALTVGGIAASTPKYRQWFVKRLAEVSITVNSGSQRQELSRITWHPVLNLPHDRLWKQVLIQH